MCGNPYRRGLFAGVFLLVGQTLGVGYASAQEADVIHFWTSGAEAKAAHAIADAFEKRGGKWIDSAVVGGPAARAAALNRIAGGNPPTAMQWTSVLTLRDLASQGVLADLDKAATDGKWKDVLPPLLYDRISFEGHVIAAPLNIQASNMMFYNKKIFSDLGLQPPKTWDEFFAVADKIKAPALRLLHSGSSDRRCTICSSRSFWEPGVLDIMPKSGPSMIPRQPATMRQSRHLKHFGS